MSHYDEVLKEARSKATGSAREYIPKLFHILVDEDKRSPEEARAIIEHDLISYWSKATVSKFIPKEAKDEIKSKAGKEGAKATNLVLAGGQTQTQTETVTKPADDKIPAEQPQREPITPADFKEEDPKDLQIEFQKEKIAELEDALRKTQQFKPATDLQPVIEAATKTDEEVHSWLRNSADGIGTFYYDTYGIELFKNRELPQLKNSGVKVFKRLYFEV
jgi:hypothetical protein